MNFKSILRITAVLCIATTSFTANAQLQLVCPLDWSALGNIDGPNPDRIILGVKASDWKKEYVDQMMVKEKECLENSTDPDSVKEVTLHDVQTRAYPNGIRSIEERDQRQQQIIVRAQQASEISQRESEAQRQQQQETARLQQTSEVNQRSVEAPQHQRQMSAITTKHEPDNIKVRGDELAQQTQPNNNADADQQVERAKSNNLLVVLAIIAAAIGGWYWNKFIRNRCPNCKSASFKKVNETETDRWRGTKVVSEKHSRGTNTRHVQTTFVMKQFEYGCNLCKHNWMKERREELGASSALGRFISGY